MQKNISIFFKKMLQKNLTFSVAVTRAIKNLRILYIDDLEEIRDSMEKVFGKIYEFSNGITKEEF